jgi:hypothetical protein
MYQIAPAWLTFGFVINKKAENIQAGNSYRDEKTRIRRRVGFCIVVTAITVWICGFYEYIKLSEMVGALTALFSFFAFIFGMMYLVTGKPFEKIDD